MQVRVFLGDAKYLSRQITALVDSISYFLVVYGPDACVQDQCSSRKVIVVL
jgi:hypothetical protein